ncbi:SH3 domain-containing protein [Proteiniclasticum sp. C24MP]|uniref:SH3 domain-containing protein n=1 Tax=Proteiniclasticum sp. C24MP TaxID=3374101 RepID=UPI0037542673
MKKTISKRLSAAISATILVGTMSTTSLAVFANPLPDVGSTYSVSEKIPGYMDSANAARQINSVTTYQPGNYYVYKIHNGMINISRAVNAPGVWINPAQNPGGEAPAAPAPVNPTPAPAVTTMKTTANLYMRTGPGTSNQSILVMPKGASVTLVEDGGAWKKITYNGKTGWASGKYLTQISVSGPVDPPSEAPPSTPDPAGSGAIYETTGNLYMRTGPATSYSAIMVMPRGASVTLVQDGEWKKVTYNGKTGWASGKYLKLIKAAPAAEPATPPAVVTPEPPAETVEPPAETVPAPAVIQKKTTHALHMRAGAGTSYTSILVLPQGAVVEVIGTEGKWNNIIYNGKTGWSSGDYLTEVKGVYKTINVPYHSQLSPVYAPVGCEATALLMALQYKGIARDVSYRQFLDAMPKHSSNPAKGFVGSPYKQDLSLRTTIYPQALTDYSNTYGAGRTVNFSGSTVEDIKKEILADNPVVVYLTVRREAPVYVNYNVEGEIQSLLRNNHAVLVTGYDSEANKLRVTDPWSWDGRREYWVDIPGFAYSYNLRNHAIVVR